MTESSCHFPGQSWLRKDNSDSADDIKSWRMRRWLEACTFEGEVDLWMDTRVMVHRKQRVPMKIWAQRYLDRVLVETKWKGLHSTLAGGSLTAFGGQLPRPPQGAAKPRREKIFLGSLAGRRSEPQSEKNIREFTQPQATLFDLILDIKS